MNKKSRSLLLIVLAMVLVLTACGGGGNKPANGNTPADGATDGATTEAKVLRTNNSSEPGSLDPALATGTHDSWTMMHIFEGLMDYNEKGEVVPGVAEKFEESEDGLTYTFTLRDGLLWSNGDPLTAKDFEFSWKRVLNPELASEYSYQLYYLEGGQEYNEGKGSVDAVGVKALDDKTLEVKLKAPVPYFVGLTAFYTLYPVNEKVVTENPDWAKDASTFVSNGAFKLTQWEHNSKIVIEKNENYFDKDKVKLTSIEFDINEDKNTEYQKYSAGEYDLIVSPLTNVVDQYKKEESKELFIGEDLGTYYYVFNTQKEPFNNAKIREALSLSIDRKTIVEKIAQGGQIPAEGMMPYGLLDDTGKDFREANGNLVSEDVEKAKTLLDEGLAEAGLTKEDLNKVILSYNTNESHKKIAQAVQEMWKQNLGIEIGLENMEFQTLIDKRREGDYTLSRAGWMGDYADPMTMLDIFMTNNPQNDPKYASPEFDEYLNKAKATADQKVRMDSMKEAEKIMMKDLPIIPVYYYTQPRLQKENVTGVFKTILNYPDLTYADIGETK